MVEFTPELLAILGYTAFALFLSLYFVPFKVVPRAWAKAVRTEGHPAQVALSQVLDGAAVKIAREVKVPTVAEIVAAVPKPDLAGLQIAIPQEAIDAAVKSAMDKLKMERVRAGRGEAGAQDMAIAQNATTNPEGASMLSGALRAIDGMVNMKLVKPATGKDWQKQLREQFASTGDITDLLGTFGIRPEMITNAGGVTVGRPGKGAQPL